MTASTDYFAADGTFKPIAGAGGIVSINGDATLAQLLTAVGPAAWSIPVAGTHRLILTQFAGSGVPGYVPDPVAHGATDYLAADGSWKVIPGAGFGVTSINADTTAAQLLTVVGPAAWSIPVAGTHRLTMDQFAGGGTTGFVPDPGAGGARYLAQDGTWQGVPIGQIVSINADGTPAQLLTVVGPAAWSIPVAGTHRITLNAFAGVGAAGYVPAPAGGTILLSYLAPDGSGWVDIPFTTLTDLSGKLPITNIGGHGLHEINALIFPSAGTSNEGLVPDSTGHAPTETLHANGTWS